MSSALALANIEDIAVLIPQDEQIISFHPPPLVGETISVVGIKTTITDPITISTENHEVGENNMKAIAFFGNNLPLNAMEGSINNKTNTNLDFSQLMLASEGGVIQTIA